jgi:hypothetical protein
MSISETSLSVHSALSALRPFLCSCLSSGPRRRIAAMQSFRYCRPYYPWLSGVKGGCLTCSNLGTHNSSRSRARLSEDSTSLNKSCEHLNLRLSLIAQFSRPQGLFVEIRGKLFSTAWREDCATAKLAEAWQLGFPLVVMFARSRSCWARTCCARRGASR